MMAVVSGLRHVRIELFKPRQAASLRNSGTIACAIDLSGNEFWGTHKGQECVGDRPTASPACGDVAI